MVNEEIEELLAATDNIEESGMIVFISTVDVHSNGETGVDILDVLLLAGLHEDIRDRSFGDLLFPDGSVPGLVQRVGAGSGWTSSGRHSDS